MGRRGECRGVVGVGCGNCVVAVRLSLCRIDQELTLLWHTSTISTNPQCSTISKCRNRHCACTEC